MRPAPDSRLRLAPSAESQRVAVITGASSRGVRVNAVAPGVIKTPEHDPTSYEDMVGLHPVGRIGEISDIVDAILYLEQATFVTGETLHIDGGQAAGH